LLFAKQKLRSKSSLLASSKARTSCPLAQTAPAACEQATVEQLCCSANSNWIMPDFVSCATNSTTSLDWLCQASGLQQLTSMRSRLDVIATSSLESILLRKHKSLTKFVFNFGLIYSSQLKEVIKMAKKIYYKITNPNLPPSFGTQIATDIVNSWDGKTPLMLFAKSGQIMLFTALEENEDLELNTYSTLISIEGATVTNGIEHHQTQPKSISKLEIYNYAVKNGWNCLFAWWPQGSF
jgi:hypothetical protein